MRLILGAAIVLVTATIAYIIMVEPDIPQTEVTKVLSSQELFN